MRKGWRFEVLRRFVNWTASKDRSHRTTLRICFRNMISNILPKLEDLYSETYLLFGKNWDDISCVITYLSGLHICHIPWSVPELEYLLTVLVSRRILFSPEFTRPSQNECISECLGHNFTEFRCLTNVLDWLTVIQTSLGSLNDLINFEAVLLEPSEFLFAGDFERFF